VIVPLVGCWRTHDTGELASEINKTQAIPLIDRARELSGPNTVEHDAADEVGRSREAHSI
jgi:hypothetical protein